MFSIHSIISSLSSYEEGHQNTWSVCFCSSPSVTRWNPQRCTRPRPFHHHVQLQHVHSLSLNVFSQISQSTLLSGWMTPAVSLNDSDSWSDIQNKQRTWMTLLGFWRLFVTTPGTRTCPGLLTAWGGHSQLISSPTVLGKQGDDEAHEVSSSPLTVTLFRYYFTFCFYFEMYLFLITGSFHHQATV